MKQVTAHIQQRTLALRENPFIQWLDDGSVPARERLTAWLPGAAFFVFGFMDLNAEIFRYPEDEADADPLKRAVNDHAAEDSNHWQWYLSDLAKLGLDEEMKFSKALRLLWSRESRNQRLATYEFCVLASRAADPVVRYSMLAALEAFAHVLFGTLLQVSEEFEVESGIQLSYLGRIHFEREPGHLVNQTEDALSILDGCVLDEHRRRLAIELADATWELIDRRWREFHRNSVRRLVEAGVA